LIEVELPTPTLIQTFSTAEFFGSQSIEEYNENRDEP
jgi:hypothetical protein